MAQLYKLARLCSGVLLTTIFSQPAFTQQLLDPKTQPQFVHQLPVPGVLNGTNGGTFNISITQFKQFLGLIDPITKDSLKTTVWGYDGTYPGPTIVAQKNVPLQVYWLNKLVDQQNNPLPHILPVDVSIHWALEEHSNWQSLGVPIVTHVHGGHSESASDGLPNAWYTPNFALKGPGFKKGDIQPYHYDNDQEAATIWYHDHALGVTRLNVYAGLAGYYILTDENEIQLQQNNKLPAAPYDLGLAIQDRMFSADGALYYPSMPEVAGAPIPSVLPEMFGDFILVNGITWPVLDVEPRQYRFRMLNGSDSRFYNMWLSSGQQFVQIGSDQGFLNAPYTVDQLLLAPGERKDIILDFSNPALWGQTIIIRNNARSPFPKGSTVDPQTTGRIMAFRVSKPLNTTYPLTSLPSSLRSPIVPLQTSLEPRKLILFEAIDEYGRLKPMLGTVDEGVKEFTEEITENPAMNSVEAWEIYNETEDAHPIHLHLVSMQLISRQKFQAKIDPVNGRPEDIRLIGHPKSPNPDEQGWKDTWIMFPGEVTKVIAKFDREGLYAWHCHILSHEEHDMMRPFYVGEMDEDGDDHDHLGRIVPNVAEEDRRLDLKLIPNPFNSFAAIEFNLSQPKNVTIRVYDNNGKMVKQVFSGQRAAGKQRFLIDGSNISAGTYYCEILLNDQRIMRKLILQK